MFFLRIDFGLLIPALVLLILGLASLFSINSDLFKMQLLFSFIAIFAFFLFSQFSLQIIRHYSIPIYIASFLLLILVLVVGIESRGSVRWFELFGFRIQLAEFTKPFLAISFASFLSSQDNKSFKAFFLTLLFLLPLTLLIFAQPDLGNAVIYFLVTIFSLIVFGLPFRFLFLFFLFLAMLSPIFWNFMRSYQRQRILTFFQLDVDPLGSSYNAIQAVIAVGSGMFFGKGMGLGTQSVLRFLPERHTDFIFATLTEELGFVGATIVLGVFLFLLYRIFFIYKNTDSLFSKLFAIISFFLILISLFVNIGMNIGIVPVVGVSLPFISYGGSSLVSNFILLGLLSSISKSTLRKDVLEIR
jgi:rod shape determining protein RodA